MRFDDAMESILLDGLEEFGRLGHIGGKESDCFGRDRRYLVEGSRNLVCKGYNVLGEDDKVFITAGCAVGVCFSSGTSRFGICCAGVGLGIGAGWRGPWHWWWLGHEDW